MRKKIIHQVRKCEKERQAKNFYFSTTYIRSFIFTHISIWSTCFGSLIHTWVAGRKCENLLFTFWAWNFFSSSFSLNLNLNREILLRDWISRKFIEREAENEKFSSSYIRNTPTDRYTQKHFQSVCVRVGIDICWIPMQTQNEILNNPTRVKALWWMGLWEKAREKSATGVIWFNLQTFTCALMLKIWLKKYDSCWIYNFWAHVCI